MADPQHYRYDVFISHSQADQEWVEEWLLPRLEGAGLAVCVDATCFEPGAPLVEETERAIRESRRTLVILSPAWVESQWDSFEALLVHAQDPAARGRRLIPLLLKPCDPPERIKLLQWVDFSEPARQETQLTRVVDAIQGTGALPELRPEDAFPSPKQRRWELRWFGVAGVAAVMTLVVLVGFIVSQNQPKRAKTMPPNAFNIAIAEFASRDKQGNTLPKDRTLPSAQPSADFLEVAIGELAEPMKQQIFVMGPEDLAFPRTGVAKENVEEIANAVHANIVVFGSMTPRSKNEWQLQLELHFSEPTVRDLAPGLYDNFPLGAPILFVNDGTGASIVNSEIEQRLEALVPVVRGLMFFSHGTAADFERALSYFLQASETEWGQSNALIQVFAGQAYLRWDYMKGNNSHLNQAELAFRKALRLDSNFYGAHNALAALLYLRAWSAQTSACWDQDLLGESYEHRSQALDLATRRDNTRMSQLSAHLGMGRALLHLGQCRGDLETLLASYEHFVAVTTAYTDGELQTNESMLTALLAHESMGYLEMKIACLGISSDADLAPDTHERLLRADGAFNQARQLVSQIDTDESRKFNPTISLLIKSNQELLTATNSSARSETCQEVMRNVEPYIP